MTQIIHIWMLLYTLNIHSKHDDKNHPHVDDKNHPQVDEIVFVKEHPKFDDTDHPHLDDFSSLSSYIGNNHNKSSKIG